MPLTAHLNNIVGMVHDKKQRWIVICIFLLVLMGLLAVLFPSTKPAKAFEAQSSSRRTLEGRCDACSWHTLTTTALGWSSSPYPSYGGKSSPDPLQNYRGFYIINLTAVSTPITDATLHLYSDWVQGGCGTNDKANITKGTLTTTSTPPTNQYHLVENDIFSNYATFASTSPTGWHTFTLNSTALAYLNTKLGDYAQLVVRSKGDIEHSSFCSSFTTIGFNTNSSSTLEAYLSYNELGASMTITAPTTGYSATTSFNVNFSYSNASDYNKAMILFEDWSASSTCPVEGTAEWTTQYPIYFNSQSKPYFSPTLSGASGTSTILIDDLGRGAFRCTRCYLINETTGAYASELCHNYTIYVDSYIPYAGQPQFWVDTDNWPTYYSENVDKWATSTELFNYLSEKVSPLMNWVGNFTFDFKNLFNASTSAVMGATMGNAVPTARGYLSIVNAYFSNLPVSEVFIFYIIVALILIVLKIVLMIWHFFRG